MECSYGCDCPLRYQEPRLANFCGQGNSTPYVIFMGILELYLRLRCDLEDPCNQIPTYPNVRGDYDFIVVGAGVAGCAVASRLSEVPNFNTLLIEAGDLPETFTRVPGLYPASIFGPADWKYFGVPQTNCFGSTGGNIFIPRGKMVGGTGCMNAMNYHRGAAQDYDSMNRDFNLSGWSYKECLPYFMRSEDNQNIGIMDEGYHATGGPQPVSLLPYVPPITMDILKAAEEMGNHVVDTNGKTHHGFTICQTFTKDGKRASPVESFLKPAMHRKSLKVLVNTTVSKINFENNLAVSVDVIYGDGRKDTIGANKEIIVTSGTIGSPQIIQLSGIGPRDVLTKAGVAVKIELDGVGENLHDHVRSQLVFDINEKATDPLSFASILQHWATSGGPLSGTGIHSLAGFLNSKYVDPNENGEHPDIQFQFMGYLPTCSKTGNVDELESSANKEGNRQITIWPINVRTNSRGYVRVKDSNINTPPEINPKYFTNGDDIKVVVEAMKMGLKLVSMPALKKYNFTFVRNAVGCEKIDLNTNLDEYLECHARFFTSGENHIVGSCRVGNALDKMAVVDSQLRIIGVDNIRVCDASVFARIPTSNTHAPTLMVAERCADFIKQTWLKNDNNGQQPVCDNSNHYGWNNLPW